jgi:hypothetical protein
VRFAEKISRDVERRRDSSEEPGISLLSSEWNRRVVGGCRDFGRFPD